MIDSGSAINMIKPKFLKNTPVDLDDRIILKGITEVPVETQGAVIFTILDKITKFYVVSNELPIPTDGILGSEFLRDNNAILDYNKELLVVGSFLIPFYKETRVRVPARTVLPVSFHVSNPEQTEGYVPRYEPVKGLYLGEALVTNSQGKGYLKVYNVTERDYTIIMKPMHLNDYYLANTNDSINFTNSSDSTDFTDSINSINSSNLLTPCYLTESDTEGVVPTTESRFTTLKTLINMSHLNKEERSHVEQILKDNEDCFFLPGDKLKFTNTTNHSIPTTDSIPVHVKQYRYPPAHREEIDRQVNKLLKDNVIQPSSSPYNAPLWIVPKKSIAEKKWRMVVDFRKLNEKTIGDAYPLPNIVEILDQLGSAKYFSIFDLAQGFHQIPMSPDDRAKTAFSTPYGHFEYLRMPFGLRNAPATFQRLMDSVLMGLQGNEVFVYLDDIVVYARSLEEHKVKIDKLMQRLKAAKLQLQPEKCQFLRHEVVYLGHVIGSAGVRPDPDKIAAVRNFPIPHTQKNIKQFLGLAGYYRRFIRNFSKLAKPLTDLLKRDAPFIWTHLQEKAFNTLRDELCKEPILQYPDFNKPFILTVDACGYAIGGVLSQGQIGKDLPLTYTSRILNNAERNYSTIEKECLAIVYCVTYFRHYLYGRHFTILTDHKPLIWLHSIKDPSSRLWKWRLRLSEYDFDINYKAGKTNAVADALSRNPANAEPPLLIEPSSSHQGVTSLPCTILSKPYDSALLPVAIPTASTYPINVNTHTLNTETNSDSGSISEEPRSVDEDDQLLRIRDTRDSILMQKDNHVILVYADGTPFDKGSRDYQQANKLPQYNDLMIGRARVTEVGNKVLIALAIKASRHSPVEREEIINCIRSLTDVIQELQLTSISIAQTDFYDNISWNFVYKILRRFLFDQPITLTICKSLIRHPEVNERKNLIHEKHATKIGGHKGVNKTYNRLRQNFYWPTMKQDIQAYIKDCRNCQIKKLTRIKTRQPMLITDTPGAAFDKISMDIVGPLPTTRNYHSYILTIQDLLTKYSVAVPLVRADSLSIAEAFVKNFICIYGPPRALLTDQAPTFFTSLIKSIASKFQIKQYRTTAYYPQSNGSIERSHHVLTEYLKMYLTNNNEWDDHLATAMFAYNTSVHEGTNYTPYALVFGRTPRIPSSASILEEHAELPYHSYLTNLFNILRSSQEIARKNLIKSKEKSKIYYDRRINAQNFRINDKVYLLKEAARSKFSDQYTGPHEVIEILPMNNVKINFKGKPRVVHVNKLKLSKPTLTIEPG